MATFAQVSKAALQLILVQESEGDYSASEYQDTMFGLNNMMADWEYAKNIRLGFTPITATADTLTVSPGAIRGIIANLAVEMAPQFDAEITPGLLLQAREGLKACRILGSQLKPMAMPSTLPMGSGNSGYAPRLDDYYSGNDYQGSYYAVKDPDSVIDITIPWADELGTDTISTSAWTATASVIVDSDTNTTTTATATVSGGSEGGICYLVNSVVTAAGKEYDKTYVLEIRDK